MDTQDLLRFMEVVGKLSNYTDQLAENKILDRVEEIEKRLNGHIVKSGGF